MRVRAVVVDIGGVLERTPPTGWVEQWEGRLGLPAGGLATVVSPIWRPGRTGEATLIEIERRTAAVLGLGEDEARALWEDVWAEYVGTLNGEFAQYLADLRPRYKTAILSNSFVGAREREHDPYGFEDLVDLVLYSHEEGLEKPDPRFYELVCERLGVRPDEALFVDDVDANVIGARRVGMKAVLFVSNDQAIREIETYLAGR
jgi:epoxide hydrolase-like predicted phosphatase